MTPDNIATLASLAEGTDRIRTPAVALLVQELSSPSPRSRNAAAEGLWQLAAIDARPHLRAALSREPAPDVAFTMAYVVRVLG